MSSMPTSVQDKQLQWLGIFAHANKLLIVSDDKVPISSSVNAREYGQYYI